jgi:predicted RNase H-like HicB family nuclease
MPLTIETDREDDGRWFAEVVDLPGCMVYGPDEASAVADVKELARCVIAERHEYGEFAPEPIFSVKSA